MSRLSQKEVEKLLDNISNSGYALNSFETTAYNYLVDYIELGDNGINRSLEGDRLFNLCVEILNVSLNAHWKQ